MASARAVFAALAAPDKALEMVPGAHYSETNHAHREALADLMADGINARP